MKHIAKALASQGRHGDTELLHVTKPELEAINRLSQARGLGALPRNPSTGLPEASLLGAILPIVGAVVGGYLTGGTGTEGGYAVGAALGGAAGGYAGSRVDHTNPYLGTVMGGVGGYMGGSAMDAAPAAQGATAAAAAPVADASAASATSALPAGAQVAGQGSLQTAQGAADQAMLSNSAQAAQAAQAEQAAQLAQTSQGAADQAALSSSAQATPSAGGIQSLPAGGMNATGSTSGIDPMTGAQNVPSGGMNATGPGYNYTDNLPPSSAPSATPTSAPPGGMQATADWIKKNPMLTYTLASGGIRAMTHPASRTPQTHNVHMAGASHSGMTYNQGAGNTPANGYQQNYFTGNYLGNYTQDPGTNVQRYADGGAVTPAAPRYSMQDTTGAAQPFTPSNAVQYGAGNNAPMAPERDLRAAPLQATSTLPAPTTPDWYATAAGQSPTAVAQQQAIDAANADAYQQAMMRVINATAGGVAAGGAISDYRQYAAGGGITSLPAAPRYLKGPGDGMSDDIPAVIQGDHRHPAEPIKVADGEYVIPADVVAHLGNGSSDAGSKHLDKVMAKVRKARTGNPKQGKQINPEKFL